MAKKRLLVTGATGYIAGQLLPALRERYDARLIDVRTENRDGQPVEGVEVIDLLDPDEERVRSLFTDVDVVVHCGYRAAASDDHEEQYAAARTNIDMTQRVYRFALETGVRRVVTTSTNQAAKWYEAPFYAGRRDRVDPEDYPRPNNFYGWAKAAYESLGFLYACGSLGRQLEVIQIRIVVPRRINADLFRNEPPKRYVRELAGYISERDLQQLYCKSIDTLDIADEHGVPFHIFYGVSNNARTFWSIVNARKVIGYEPEDDSEVEFAADIAQLLR